MDLKPKINLLRELKAAKKELYWLIYSAANYRNIEILRTDLNRLTKRNRNIISHESNIFYHLHGILPHCRLDGTIVELYDQGDLASIRLSGEYSDLVSKSYLNKRYLDTTSVHVVVLNVDVDKLNEIVELWNIRYNLISQLNNIDGFCRSTRHYHDTIRRFNQDYKQINQNFDKEIENCENKNTLNQYQPSWTGVDLSDGYFQPDGFVFNQIIQKQYKDLCFQHENISQKISDLNSRIEKLYLDMKLN
jgi:hypothetical protein